VEARGPHPRVIGDEEVARPQQIGKFGEAVVGDARTLNLEET
jgi:hypothetical protein